MASDALNSTQTVQAKMRYSAIMRCLGQTLEGRQLKAVEVKTHGEDFIVQAWQRGPSMTLDSEKHYTLDDIRKLDAEGRAKRRPGGGTLDLLSLSQILRFAGNYVDRISGRLVRVSWQDQSDKIQSVTMQWEVFDQNRGAGDTQLANIEEVCIHIYKRHKRIALATERQAHRPFVSVGRPT